MAALVVFVVVSTATVAILIQALRVVRENSDRVMAASIARSEVEYLRSLGTTAIPIGLMVGAVPTGQNAARVDPRLLDPEFTIRTTSNWVGFDQTQNSCAAATPGQAYLRVSVEVSGSNLDRPVTVDTVLFPAAVTQTSGTGSATVSVVDQAGAPVSDVLVRGTDTIQPPNNFSLTTGTDGCLFIPGRRPTGSLAINVSRAGYVSQTPTGTSAVLQITAGTVSRSTFKLAPAAVLEFSGMDSDFPVPAGMPVTWQFKTTGASVAHAAVGTPVTGLWPEPSGITVFAGSCADADPLSYAVSRDSFSLDAGGTSTALLSSAPVRVRGLPADTPVTARYVGADAACATTPLVVGRSNSVGVLRVGMPYGDWEFSAGGQTHRLTNPARPQVDGSTPEPVVVAFTLADLDNPCPTASPTESPTPNSHAYGEPIAVRVGLPQPVRITMTRPAHDAYAVDDGFTLVELMVAVAVFGSLMVIVGGAMLSGFSGVRNIANRTENQASAQIAAEWTAKLLRYADVPEGQAASITEASPTSITFYTYSGTGAKHDVPYRARIYTVTNANGTRSLTTSVWTPREVAGGWTWTTAPVVRTHLTLPASAAGPLTVAVWVRNPLTVPPAAPRLATPATSGPLVLATGEVPESVVLQIGDRNDPRNLVTQQVRLGNLP